VIEVPPSLANAPVVLIESLMSSALADETLAATRPPGNPCSVSAPKYESV
jgi:hypothetical protein